MARSIRGWCFFEGALGRPASEQGGLPAWRPVQLSADAVTDQQELRRLALEGLPRLQHSQEVNSAIARSASVRTLFGIHDPRGLGTRRLHRAALTQAQRGSPRGRLGSGVERRQRAVCFGTRQGDKKLEAKAGGLNSIGVASMCDYSLRHVASRPARVGDKLVSTTFVNSSTRGFPLASQMLPFACYLERSSPLKRI